MTFSKLTGCPVYILVLLFAVLLPARHATGAEEFQAKEFTLPDGFEAQLVAAPPLVTHPTMGCFDDQGRLFVCNNAGVNMSAAELEEHLPNSIHLLQDEDGDGVFDSSTVFADRMTFPMGGAWHDGALYVASPPCIWRLEDTTGDGVADKRDILVDSFGYTGNAASVHGCFLSPTGRLYWCDGYHGHEFRDEDGNVISKRKASYLFSCWPDGSDVRIHCGGGMDNPVEVDFTDEGDVIGTVNILYSRPRIDCLVHWQYGGAYPHREAALSELQVTGEVLGPVHGFGHVAISGTASYRSGAMNNAWRGNFFATEFNLGKVVRVELQRQGSTYSATEREFLSCSDRDFHPTDVLEDADGSLLVIDTGGWFYRGCPTSQIAKPDVLGGIYRIRKSGMKQSADPRGKTIDWSAMSDRQLMSSLQDGRFAVRNRAVQACVRRGGSIVASLVETIADGDVPARRNAIWAATQIYRNNRSRQCRSVILQALTDQNAGIRQAAWHALGAATMLTDKQIATLNSDDRKKWMSSLDQLKSAESVAAVRREAFATLSVLRLDLYDWLASYEWSDLDNAQPDREERHALHYAMLATSARHIPAKTDQQLPKSLNADRINSERMVVLDQISKAGISPEILKAAISAGGAEAVQTAAQIATRQAADGVLSAAQLEELRHVGTERFRNLTAADDSTNSKSQLVALINAFGDSDELATAVAETLSSTSSSAAIRLVLLGALSSGNSHSLHPAWKTPIGILLASNDNDEQLAAIRAAGAVAAAVYQDELFQLATDSSLAVRVQTEALKAAGRNRKAMSKPEVFALALAWLEDGATAQRQAAAQVLSTSSLTDQQLAEIVPLLSEAGPQQLADLVKLFKRSLTPDLAELFLDALGSARSRNSVPTIEVSEIVKRFPPDLHDQANTLLDALEAAEQAKVLKLDAMIGELSRGDASRGMDVFFNEKAKCATCHVVGAKGKRVGPDLTTIGANRSSKDLLESIMFPSATLVRQYEPYTVLTEDGRTFSGLVIRETSDAVTVQQSTGDPVTIARKDIEELIPGTVSIMPKGLDEALSSQQIADLVAWLQSLK